MKKNKIVIAYLTTLVCLVCFISIILIGNHEDDENHEIDVEDYKKMTTEMKNITVDEFETKIKGKETFALFIGSEGCGNCKEVLPIFLKTSESLKLEGFVYYMDISSKVNKPIIDLYGVNGTPTILFVKVGKIKNRLEGSLGDHEKENKRLRIELEKNFKK
ncbi:thioredoxin family protein [Enterococcus sp. LJL99]